MPRLFFVSGIFGFGVRADVTAIETPTYTTVAITVCVAVRVPGPNKIVPVVATIISTFSNRHFQYAEIQVFVAINQMAYVSLYS